MDVLGIYNLLMTILENLFRAVGGVAVVFGIVKLVQSRGASGTGDDRRDGAMAVLAGVLVIALTFVFRLIMPPPPSLTGSAYAMLILVVVWIVRYAGAAVFFLGVIKLLLSTGKSGSGHDQQEGAIGALGGIVIIALSQVVPQLISDPSAGIAAVTVFVTTEIPWTIW